MALWLGVVLLRLLGGLIVDAGRDDEGTTGRSAPGGKGPISRELVTSLFALLPLSTSTILTPSMVTVNLG